VLDHRRVVTYTGCSRLPKVRIVKGEADRLDSSDSSDSTDHIRISASNPPPFDFQIIFSPRFIFLSIFWQCGVDQVCYPALSCRVMSCLVIYLCLGVKHSPVRGVSSLHFSVFILQARKKSVDILSCTGMPLLCTKTRKT
jgi:hypothetical protein